MEDQAVFPSERPKRDRHLWVYTILPPVAFNLWSFILYLPYYALLYTNPDWVGGIQPGMITLVTYAFILAFEWLLVVFLLQRMKDQGVRLKDWLLPGGGGAGLRLKPALVVVVLVNVVAAAFFALSFRLYPDLRASYSGIHHWQRWVMILLLPISAAFCEELIWRGYIPAQLKLRGRTDRRILVISSLSFALIHGIFLWDKLLMTFLIGIIAGRYVLKEKSLLPVMAAHWLMDAWSFAFFLFA